MNELELLATWKMTAITGMRVTSLTAMKSFTLLLIIPCYATTIRLVTFNIHAWRDVEHTDSLERLVELLVELKPDVLCLNEVLHPWTAPAPDDPYWTAVRERRGHGYQIPTNVLPEQMSESHLVRLAVALGLPHAVFGCANSERSYFGSAPFGNAILSRYPLRDVRSAVMQPDEADLYLGEQTRTPSDLEDRAVLTARLLLPEGRGMGICSTHLDHKAEELRAKQIQSVLHFAGRAFGAEISEEESAAMAVVESSAAMLPVPLPAAAQMLNADEQAEAAAGSPDDSHVPYCVCGDLNTYDKRDLDDDAWNALCALARAKGWSAPRAESLVTRELRRQGFIDAFELYARARDSSDAESAATTAVDGACEKPPPTGWTGCRLDYIMLSPAAAAGAIQVTGHRTISSRVSDHLPVVCDLIIE